jgi:hypothetical protein
VRLKDIRNGDLSGGKATRELLSKGFPDEHCNLNERMFDLHG